MPRAGLRAASASCSPSLPPLLSGQTMATPTDVIYQPDLLGQPPEGENRCFLLSSAPGMGRPHAVHFIHACMHAPTHIRNCLAGVPGPHLQMCVLDSTNNVLPVCYTLAAPCAMYLSGGER